MVSVWARDSNSPGAYGASPYTYDAFNSSQSFTLTTPCAAVTVSAAPASPAVVGTQVTITGTATGCAHPLYQFWILPPGGTWALAQSYSASTTFRWNTSGSIRGSYLFSVWARDSGSPGAVSKSAGGYDTYDSNVTYTLK